jgi:hemoglobin
VVSGGSCVYEGETMKNSHAEMKIRKADFNALVEVLQQSMDRQGIPFSVQNRLLARLAPMHRDIVNTR